MAGKRGTEPRTTAMENHYSEEEIERCTITDRREIVFLLRGLIKQGHRFSVLFQEGRQSFLTVLIEVSEANERIYFDIGGSPETNRAFLNAEHSTFTTYVEGIRIQFSVKKGEETSLRGERVFAVPLPRSLLRLQRRELFRVELPTANPYLCRIRRGSPQEEVVPLHDISIGGIGVRSTKPLNYEQLEVLENCWIDLHEAGMLQVRLEVRYVASLTGRTGKPLWHIGCKFLALTPANEVLIQRFMARIEAERRALSAG